MAGTWSGTTYVGDASNEKVTGTAADEIITGLGGSDTLKGGAGDDRIGGYSNGYDYFDAQAGIDKVYGEAGDDVLNNSVLSPKGALIDGGSGTDTAVVVSPYANGASHKVTFALNEKSGSYATVDGKQTLFVVGAEKLEFYGYGQATITGGASDDRITALGGNAVLKGLGGNDVLSGGVGGNLDGGAGDDFLSGSARLSAVITAKGGAGTGDSFSLYDASPFALTMAGDTVKGMTIRTGKTALAQLSGIEGVSVRTGTGNDVLKGGIGADNFDDAGGRNAIATGLGDDQVTVTLDKLADTVDLGGQEIADLVRLSLPYGTNEAVVMTGTIGSFTAKLGATTSAVVKGAERVYVYAGTGDDKVFGGDTGSDYFSLGTGANTLKAGDGADTAMVTLDKLLDRLDGGAGIGDRLDIDAQTAATEAIVMTLNRAGFDLRFGAKLAIQGSNWEGLDLTGSNKADTLLGMSGYDRFEGGEGDDVIKGFGGSDTLVGGAGKDLLDGGEGNDTLVAGNGVPKFVFDPANPFGGGSSRPGALVVDTLKGGGGIDTADFTDLSLGYKPGEVPAGVSVDLSSARTVKASVGKVTVATLSSIENLTGSDYNDKLTGDRQDNVLSGGRGINVLDGGAGSDTASYNWLANDRGRVSIVMKDAGDLVVTAQPTLPGVVPANFKDTLRSIENISGSQNGDQITGNKLANVLDGDFGDDVLKGGGGNDTLKGGFGTDTLDGGVGDDRLSDYAGNATMTGGAGSDTFAFNFTPRAGSNTTVHTITDFKPGVDEIELSSFSFDLLPTVPGKHLDAKLFVDLDAKGAKVADTTRLIYHHETGDLAFDADGRGGVASIKFASFENHAKLSAADFIVV